jgi:Na+-transporting NADH:ubiquinone oxidoreductase subunit NqrB
MRSFLARTNISRLMLYYLLALLAGALLLVAIGLLPYRPVDICFTAAILLATCWAVNWAFTKAFAARSNWESVAITALILTLIISPFGPSELAQLGFAVFAAAWAMASKYIFAIRKKHFFNPAAFGVALAALALGTEVSWWVGGSLYLLVPTLIGGVLVWRKMRCTNLLLAFSAAVVAMVVVLAGPDHALTALNQAVLHSMFFFFAFVMLTEPRTAPVGNIKRIAYAALVGVMFVPETHIGSFYFTPEIALLIGNVFTLAFHPRRWTARRPAFT